MSKKHIVIAGAGFGGLYTLMNLRKTCSPENFKITIIDRKTYFTFTPLLHEVASGNLHNDDIITPIREITKRYDADFLNEIIEKIDLNSRFIRGNNGTTLTYDYLVISTGSTTDHKFHIENSRVHRLKNITDADQIRRTCIKTFEKSENTSDEIRWVILGGGYTGIEIAAELCEFAEALTKHYSIDKDKVSIELITSSDILIKNMPNVLQEKAESYLGKIGLKVKKNSKVKAIIDNKIDIVDEASSLFADLIVNTTGVKAAYPTILGDVKYDSDSQRIKTTNKLHLEKHSEAFICGDVSDGNPMDAQVAVKQAKVIAENIHAQLMKNQMKSFAYESSGNLVSLGKKYALGVVHNRPISGRYVWFIWRTVYLSKMILKRKQFSVAFNWTLNLFTERDVIGV